MEYHCNKDGGMGVVSRIFEKGLESFDDEIEFVLRSGQSLGKSVVKKGEKSVVKCSSVPQSVLESVVL